MLTCSPQSNGRDKSHPDTPALRKKAGLRREERVRRRKEYITAQARGKRRHTPHFGVCLAPGEGSGPRLGLVVGRKVGPATRRNRVKRLLREFFRLHKHRLPNGVIIIMAKKGAADLSYHQVAAELTGILLPRHRPGHHD